MPLPKLTILVSGMIAGDPNQGGATWAVLQYLLGFRRLGHNVYFVEPIQDSAVRPLGMQFDRSTNADYFRRVAAQFRFGENSALLRAGSQETVGLSYMHLRELAARADVLVNISGMLADQELIGRIPVRVYLDLDPAFIQFWHVVEKIDMRFAGHTHFVTIGQAIGQEGCPVPTCGLTWIPTAQPIVLDHWPVATTITHNALTTIGNWRGYGSIEHQGLVFGQKAHSLRPLIDLPRRTREPFLLAMAIHPGESKDLAALAEYGWRLIDPTTVAGTPDDYRRFIQGSKAEFGLAKSGYAASRCGWFSDRSVCYLASGRPVVAQDTGFSRWLPTGQGLFTFTFADDVLAGIDALNADYPHHARAARMLAEEFFDSDKVLSRLLRRVGALP